MRHWKRLFYYLTINVLVSACTVLAVLSIWDWARAPTQDEVEFPSIELTGPAPLSTTMAMDETNLPPETESESPETPLPVSTEPASAQRVEEYVVRAGDTLGAIAAMFDVSIEALMEANDLPDPDRLDVGQRIIIPATVATIPVRTSLPAEDTATPSPTPRPTSTPLGESGPPEVAIESVIGASDLSVERVYLKRTGSGELSLSGWQLLEKSGNVFTFPNLTLYEAGSVYVYTRSGQPTPINLYWGLEKSVWHPGDTVVLLDAQGKVRATYQVP